MMALHCKRALVPVLLATTVLASPAAAQDAEIVPPVREFVDQNGVNLSTGKAGFAKPSISIGSGSQGLLFRQFTNSNHPYMYTILGSTTGPQTVVAGERSLVFDQVGSAYVNKQGTGETLTLIGSAYNGSWTFTDRDGTVVHMDLSQVNPAADLWRYLNAQTRAIANTVIFPNKQKLTFTYKYLMSELIGGDQVSNVRLQSVTSSNGYMGKFEYSSDTSLTGFRTMTKITLLNLAVDYCSPSADSCSFTQTWPSLTFGSNPITVTDTLNRTTTYGTGYATIRRPGSATDNVVVTDTGSPDFRVSSVNVDGRTWNYAWSLAGTVMTATITNPDSSQRVIVSNTDIGQPTSVRDELNRTISYAYDADGRLTQMTFPEGNKLQYTYDTRGNVSQSRAISKTPGTPPDIVVSAAYASTCANALSCNKPTSFTDARGKITDYTYDATHGGLLTVTSPAPATGAVRPQARYSYVTRQAYFKNSGGSIVASGQSTYVLSAVSTCQTLSTCAGAADEVKATIDYGAQVAGTANNLLPLSISWGSGNNSLTATVATTYDSVGNATHVDGPLPGSTDTVRTLYDAGRQVIGQISPDPDGAGPLLNRAVRSTYNLDGQPTKAENGTTAGQSDANWTAFAAAEAVDIVYDASGRVTQQKLSSGASSYALTQISYDALGRPECSALRMNTAQFASLPASACTLDTQGSHGPDRIGKIVYDAAGQVTQNRVAVGVAGEEAAERTLTYTANGRLQTLTDAENNKTTYEYDGHDRLAKTRFPSAIKGSGVSTTTDYELLGYDAASNITSRRLRDGSSIAFTYDNLDRPTLKNLPGTEPDVTYAYDNLSRLTSATQTGNALTFTYDALSRNLTQVGPQGTATSAWDLAGRRTRLTYPGTGLYVDMDYLVTGETTKIRENGATTGVGVLATYAYDNLGRRTSLTFGNGASQAFAYDPVSRLASLTNQLTGTANDLTATFAYNPASQIISTSRSGDAYAWTGHFNQDTDSAANGLNRITIWGGKALTHNINGNTTAIGSETFGYSSENLLTSGPGATTLAYDPLMRLYQTVSGATTMRLAYDGLDRIAEYNASNVLQRRYVHGPAMDEPLVWYEGTGTTNRRYLSADERGSIVSVTDSAGAVLGLNKYDEFGLPQTTNLGAFGYTGQARLPSVGLWYYKARVYEPELGRFLQVDPIGYEDSANLYAYVGGDPINFVDPLGLQQGPLIVVCGNCGWQNPSFESPQPVSNYGWSGGTVGGISGGDPNRDIVVRGQRIRRVHRAARTAASIIIPGWDLGSCLIATNCSASEWGLAAFDLVPGWGKLGKLAKLRKFCGCLEAGTMVVTPDGLVPIEKLTVGDLVLAIDEKTGEIAPKPITDLIRPDPKPLYRLSLTDAGGEAETFHATDDHPWKVEGRGWVETVDLKRGDRIDTGSGADMLVSALTLTSRVERTYNLTVADWHTFMVGEDRVVVHNACDPRKVADVLKQRKASIQNAPLPKGSPSWDKVRTMTMDEIRQGARANEPGYKTILKLLTDNRFGR